MKARIQNSVSARCGSTCPRRRTYTRSGEADEMSKREKCVAFSVREGGRENREVCRESWGVGSERWEVRSKNREVGSERRGISKESPLLF